jgi:Fe-S-cluster containining protein
MIYPAEVRMIADHSGLSQEEVAEPYPEEIILPSGTRCSFEWALRTIEGRCIFLEDGDCQIYPVRPWICRTYPFMLADTSVLQTACPGLGKKITGEEALALACDLIHRREAERTEENQVQVHGRHLNQVKGRHILIDGDGVKILEP